MPFHRSLELSTGPGRQQEQKGCNGSFSIMVTNLSRDSNIVCPHSVDHSSSLPFSTISTPPFHSTRNQKMPDSIFMEKHKPAQGGFPQFSATKTSPTITPPPCFQPQSPCLHSLDFHPPFPPTNSSIHLPVSLRITSPRVKGRWWGLPCTLVLQRGLPVIGSGSFHFFFIKLCTIIFSFGFSSSLVDCGQSWAGMVSAMLTGYNFVLGPQPAMWNGDKMAAAACA